jgi:hypothetical protein
LSKVDAASPGVPLPDGAVFGATPARAHPPPTTATPANPMNCRRFRFIAVSVSTNEPRPDRPS